MKASMVSTEAKVGILVLVGLILLFFMSFRVSRLERFKGVVYTALFPSVSGLAINANVEVAGVPVGRVEKIGLKKGMAEVTMKIGQAQIHTDAEAAVKTHGMLGDKYIEVKPGSPDAPLLLPGAEITKVKTIPDVDELLTALESAANGMAELGKSLHEAVGGEEGRNKIKEIVDNLENITAKVKTGEGTLGKLVYDDKLYAETEKTMRKAQKAMEGIQEQTPITILSAIAGFFF